MWDDPAEQKTNYCERRLLLYVVRAAVSWPLRGVDDLDDFNLLMICGEPTLEPRLEPVPVRIPLPRVPGNIFQVQKHARQRQRSSPQGIHQDSPLTQRPEGGRLR